MAFGWDRGVVPVVGAVVSWAIERLHESNAARIPVKNVFIEFLLLLRHPSNGSKGRTDDPDS